jgi:hypothetical protein
MIEKSNVLDGESLLRLSKMRGQTLRRIFGHNLDNHLMSEDISIETESSTITLWGEVDSLGDWEGFEGQYAVFRIEEGRPKIYLENDLNPSKSAIDNSFYFHAGARIEGISIVRESIRKEVQGALEWVYTTDTAIIFELSDGVFAVSKTVLDGEMLAITRADSFEKLEIPPADSFWFHWNEMGTEFFRKCEVLKIDELTSS